MVLLACRLGGHQHRRLVLLLHSLYSCDVSRRSNRRRRTAHDVDRAARGDACVADWNHLHRYLSPTVHRVGPKTNAITTRCEFRALEHIARFEVESQLMNDAHHEAGSRDGRFYVLPGEDLVEAGIRDLREGRETIEALLVAIGAPRLRRLGVELPDCLPDNPEHRLYDLLAKDDSDSANSRYN